MRKVALVKAIVKLYFLGALTGSFIHIVTAAHKLGGQGIEAWVTPLMIDGIAVIGMVMRSHDFSDRTNRIGFKVQCVMGLFSLTMNVYAAHNFFGVLFGVAIVSLFIFAEWLSGQIKSRKSIEDAEAIAEAEAVVQATANLMAACTHPTTCTSTEQCTRKAAAAAKRSQTVARKNRQRKAQQKALESLVNA